jgi:pathogen-inducible salicylic acid glucosyltransferase
MQEAVYMASEWRAKTIGPTVPASYLGGDRLPQDTVVYASFGSPSDLDPAEMREVAHGLIDAGRPFLWVVRASESHKPPAGYAAEQVGARGLGLVLSWCSRTAPLGCFLTRCGWNSTAEALITGAYPWWPCRSGRTGR